MSTIPPTFISTFRAGTVEPVAIRSTTDADHEQLVRLAERDSGVIPHEPLLVAEASGEIRAAISLSDGGTIADPFHPTADLVALLRARARHAHAVHSWPGRVVLRTAQA
ncbi:MAG: hypothetical protein ACJ75R_04925 [Solirubrobacterales bacterium]